jgi:transposase InsO family protein
MMSMFDPSQFHTIDEIETFVAASDVFDLAQFPSRQDRARWARDRLLHFQYRSLRRKQQGVLRRFLRIITGYSEAQLSRHIARYRRGECVFVEQRRNTFDQTYTREDRELLALIDNETGRMSGCLAAQFCADQYATGDERFRRLKDVSSATIYRLRKDERYEALSITIEKTKPVQTPIGERRKPEPDGVPGFIRVDTVHQGDFGLQKGVYHINMVDEVTQWEVVIAVENISESLLKEVLTVALFLFPFRIRNFHSDNGSEYINYTVAGLLEKLRIRQTKGRPRHSNDNGLAETKNGAIIRKEMGHFHIPGKFAPRINVFYRDHLIPFLNFHRPCHFPHRMTLKNGKVIVRYRRKDCQTPYRKLLSLPDWQRFLRRGITAADLEKQATEKTPLQAAQEKNAAKRKLFSIILPKLSATIPPSLTQ